MSYKMIFVKQVLFMLFLTTASTHVPQPPVKSQTATTTATTATTTTTATPYNPSSCSVTNYDFTFIYDDADKVFKVHGLWAEQCAECLTCGYPSCCNTANMSYVHPSDPKQVAFLNARWFNATTREECFNKRIGNKRIGNKRIGNKRIEHKRIGNKRIGNKRIGNKRIKHEDNEDEVSLFEHEFFKHASCTAWRQSASEFVEQVMRLYDTYYATHVANQCGGYSQLWLNLDDKFAYNNVTKCL
jgi:hypothetical protein